MFQIWFFLIFIKMNGWHWNWMQQQKISFLKYIFQSVTCYIIKAGFEIFVAHFSSFVFFNTIKFLPQSHV